MLRLSMLPILIWYLCTGHAQHQGYGTDLVLIVDQVHDFNFGKLEQFKKELCTSILLNRGYCVTVDRWEYVVESLCITPVGPVTRYTVDTSQQSYPKALDEALKIAYGRGAQRKVVVLITSVAINCNFYGYKHSYGASGVSYCFNYKGSCSYPYSHNCVPLDELRRKYKTRVTKVLNRLTSYAQGFAVIVIRIGTNVGNGTVKSWIEAADNWTRRLHYKELSSYSELRLEKLPFVKSATGLMDRSSTPWKWSSTTAEKETSAERMASTPNSTVTKTMTASGSTRAEAVITKKPTSNTAPTSTESPNLSLLEYYGYPHTNGVQWWMFIPVALIGIAVILCLVYVGHVIYYKHQQPNRSLASLLAEPGI